MALSLEQALDSIVTDPAKAIDGRMKGVEFITDLAAKYPQQCIPVLNRSTAKLEALDREGLLDIDTLESVRLETEIDAIRACIGASMARDGVMVKTRDGELGVHPALSQYCRLTDQLFKALQLRKKADVSEDPMADLNRVIEGLKSAVEKSEAKKVEGAIEVKGEVLVPYKDGCRGK